MNFVKYSHCTALRLRGKVVETKGAPRPEDYLLIRRRDAESKESVKQEDANGKAEGKG
jgi:hypothetical protein